AAVTTGAVDTVINASGQTFGPSLTPNAIKAVLEYTALPMAGYDTLTQGAGSLNVAGAIAVAKVIDPTVKVGQSWLTSGVTPSTTIAGQSLAWSRQSVRAA